MIDGRSIIIGIGLGLGTALAFQSVIALAEMALTPIPTFMIAGSISPTGIGRRLVIDEEGRVVCSPAGK